MSFRAVPSHSATNENCSCSPCKITDWLFFSNETKLKRGGGGKKELAISDLSGIWTWGVHISCSLNHWVKLMLQDLNLRLQDVWGIYTSCSWPHFVMLGIWTWGIHTHHSLGKFFSCCGSSVQNHQAEEWIKLVKMPGLYPAPFNEFKFKLLRFFSCCWVQCKITKQGSGLDG